jgi:hypothetical protein
VQLLVRVRVLLARHPVVYWIVVALVALQIASAVDARLDRLDEARRSWTETREVWVAVGDHQPGNLVVAQQRTLPVVGIPATALTEEPRGVAVQWIDAGSVLTSADLGGDRLALLPDGWQGVAVSTGAPALPIVAGDHVAIVTGVEVLADDAIVMSVDDATAVVAVPASAAPDVATAAQDQALALTLRRP